MANSNGRGTREDDFFYISSRGDRKAPQGRPNAERRPDSRDRTPRAPTRNGYNDFENISEYPRQRPSQQSPSRRGNPQGRGSSPPRPQYAPDRERPSRRRQSVEDRRDPTPKRKKKEKIKRKLGRAGKVLLTIFTVLLMIAITAFVCVFLLFKISEIKITGDAVYEDSMILEICGYQEGDNLFLVSTRDKERELIEQLPYIADAEISRHVPGTIEIKITGAQIVSNVHSNGIWLYVSTEGKIVEQQTTPMNGVMDVRGIVPVTDLPGQLLRCEDESTTSIFTEVTTKIYELGALDKFTELDISDIYDIRLLYEDRIEFRLGSSAELAYKIEFGYHIASDPERIGPKERGVLYLSDADDSKRANFMANADVGPTDDKLLDDESSAPETGDDAPEADSPESGAPETDTPETSASQDDTPESSAPKRGEEIPDAPFTG